MACANTLIHGNEQGDFEHSFAAFNYLVKTIDIVQLSKTYPIPFARLKAALRRKTKPPVQALRDVSFSVECGEIFGLIGRNGAGKTTLTKIIATLVQPTSGSVRVNGYDSVSQDEQVRAQIGLATAEERSFYWRLTGEQNLLFFARLYGMNDSKAKRKISELFCRFELEDAAGRRFGELSTGNKQRLAVARALLPEPPILLLDEPTRSLDPLAASRMRNLISALARQTPPVTILFTSHNLSEVETLCDRVAIISGGQIKAIDKPEHLRSLSSSIERVVISVKGLKESELQTALEPAVTELKPGAGDDELLFSFNRELKDDLLDRALRLIHLSGGQVTNIEIERPTLLDVLESYENGNPISE